jgi:hypothetical protein
MQNLLEDTNQTIFAVRNHFPLNTVDNIIVLLPENAEYELGFRKSLSTLINLSKNINAKLIFYGFSRTLNIIQNFILKNSGTSQFSLKLLLELKDIENLDERIGNDDMLIAFLPRPKSVSHNIIYDNLIEELAENTEKNNFVILYPEQNPTIIEEDISHYDVLETSPIQENIARINSIKQYIKKLLNK